MNQLAHTVGRPKFAAWLASVVGLTVLVILLSLAIRNDPTPSQDLRVLEWIAGWDAPGLTPFMEAVSLITEKWPALGLAVAGIAAFFLLGLRREAVALALVAVVLGGAAFLGDFTLGEIVGRSRPLEPDTTTSFPSGHVFGSMVFFGVLGFVAIYYRLNTKLLIPLLLLIVAFIVAVGISRIHLQDHWPSDVAGGFLYAVLWLLLLIPLFLRIRNFEWRSSPPQTADLTAIDCEDCRIESSIASTVLLDPNKGTATKVYTPPGIVRLLYWVAFQAKFPYENNRAALQAATYRRKIASALTRHKFGKDLVAHVTAVDCAVAECSFVTEFIPGEKVENDAETRRFLQEVVDIFAEAGLSVWQVNPRNPHAHTNLIRTPEGDAIIIDLESAVVTPFPAPGQWRSALRRGTVPIFDDIDFDRLGQYIEANESALEASLGVEDLAELRHDAKHGEEAIRVWQSAEPRIWGLIVRNLYYLLDWKGAIGRIAHKMGDADQAAEAFLNRGLDRWEKEGRLAQDEATSLRSSLTTGEIQDAMHHMGAHMVLSVAVAIPIPGLRSLARLLWTVAFWVKAQGRFFRNRGGAGGGRNIHTPLVMLIALIPAIGAVAYLASQPLRHRLLVRLLADQAAWSLPFGLYRRLDLGRRLARAPVGGPNVAGASAE